METLTFEKIKKIKGMYLRAIFSTKNNGSREIALGIFLKSKQFSNKSKRGFMW